jgi:2-polyprenyl-3-methyl-5-hydroxy-6-metoxy-1,4-benzoquinol methylase
MRDLDRYQDDYEALPFEAIQLRYRRRKVLEILARLNPSSVLEVGCGLLPLFVDYAAPRAMHVVEPAARFHENANRMARKHANVSVHLGTLQERAPGLSVERFDCIVISSLLHEVDEPADLLAAARALCSATTMLHINVPNANSFHRLLAVEMGIIANAHELSGTQKQMQQAATYDIQSLSSLLESAGFDIIERGSFFVKPFTHAQMAALHQQGILTESILDGLYAMDKHLPAMGSEIYVNCRRR